jgi:hypothetical protein
MPRSGIAGSPEFKRVAKWRISASLVSWRISDVKAESRLTWPASVIPSRVQLRGRDKPGRLWLGKYQAVAEPRGDRTFPSVCDEVEKLRALFGGVVSAG